MTLVQILELHKLCRIINSLKIRKKNKISNNPNTVCTICIQYNDNLNKVQIKLVMMFTH